MSVRREFVPEGSESVWDYPRPPRLETVPGEVRVELGDQVIAQTRSAVRMLETSHPPTIYIPPSDIVDGVLVPNEHRTFCEWKGVAHYYDAVVGETKVANAGWYYPSPSRRYPQLKDFVSFYPAKMSACFVDGERVKAQEGDFYGGWITSKIVGPFKGAPGTSGW